MTALDTALDAGRTALRTGFSTLLAAAARAQAYSERAPIALKGLMPKGLFARALLIIIVPMVVLQSVVAFMHHAYDRGIRFFDLADLYGTHVYFREALSPMA